MLEVLEGQLKIAEETGSHDAIMVVKVIEDEFKQTFGHLE